MYNEKFKSEIKKRILITIASERIKHLGINLTKELQNIYFKNDKTLSEEVKNNLINRRTVIFIYIRRLDIVKMAVLLKLIYISNIILTRIAADFFV